MALAGRIANGPRPIIDIESLPVRATTQRPATATSSDLKARLGALMGEESPEQLGLRLAEFKRSVRNTLLASSSAYAILDQLASSGLADCAKCTREIEARLVSNPHYIVLNKLEEAERQIAAIPQIAR